MIGAPCPEFRCLHRSRSRDLIYISGIIVGRDKLPRFLLVNRNLKQEFSFDTFQRASYLLGYAISDTLLPRTRIASHRKSPFHQRSAPAKHDSSERAEINTFRVYRFCRISVSECNVGSTGHRRSTRQPLTFLNIVFAYILSET